MIRIPLAVGLLGVAVLVAPPAATAAATCGGRTATIVLGPGDDVFRGTTGDDVVVLGAGDDQYSDPGGDDVICAGSGTDIVDAGDGDDRVLGGTGETEMYDGPGHDLYDAEAAIGALYLDGHGTVVHVEEGHERGNDADEFRGIRIFYGTDGDDVFVGTDGDDSFGGPGGDDLVRLRGGDDWAQVWGDGSRVFAGRGADELSIMQSRRVEAGPGDDVVNLNDSAATTRLGAGDDLVQAYASAADLLGGPGDDILRLASDGVGARVDLARGTGRLAPARFRVDSFTFVVGTPYDDVLRGSSADEFLQGGAGDDLLVGRGGIDQLVGDQGRDRARGGPGTDSCLAEQQVSC